MGKININQNQLYSTSGALDPRFIVDSVDKIENISNAYIGLEVKVVDSENNIVGKYRIKKINSLTKKPLPANEDGYELIKEPKDLKYSDGTPFLNEEDNINPDPTIDPLPSYSSLDNGKVLGLDNGNPTWVSQPNISGKIDKVSSASGKLPKFTVDGNLESSNIDANSVLIQHLDISGKADKVTGSDLNNKLVILDKNGNMKSSGLTLNEFRAELDEDYIPKPSVNPTDGQILSYDETDGTKWVDNTTVHIKYAATDTPTSNDMHDSIQPGDLYIGIYSDNNFSNSTSYTDYKWSKIVGIDGTNGIDGKSAFELWKETTGRTTANEADYIEDLQTKVAKWIPVAYEATAASATIGDTVTFTTAPSNPIDGAIVLMPNAASSATATMMFAVSEDPNTQGSYIYTYIGDLNVDTTGLLGIGDIDNTQLANPLPNALAKAVDVKRMGDGIKAEMSEEIELTYSNDGGHTVKDSGYDPTESVNFGCYKTDVSAYRGKTIEYLGFEKTSYHIGAAFFKTVDGADAIIEGTFQDFNGSGGAVAKIYRVRVPDDAEYFACTWQVRVNVDGYYVKAVVPVLDRIVPEVARLTGVARRLEDESVVRLTQGYIELGGMYFEDNEILPYTSNTSRRIYYMPVHTGDKVEIRATNSTSKIMYVGFTQDTPAVGVAVTGVQSNTSKEQSFDVVAPYDGYLVVYKYYSYFLDLSFTEVSTVNSAVTKLYRGEMYEHRLSLLMNGGRLTTEAGGGYCFRVPRESPELYFKYKHSVGLIPFDSDCSIVDYQSLSSDETLYVFFYGEGCRYISNAEVSGGELAIPGGTRFVRFCVETVGDNYVSVPNFDITLKTKQKDVTIVKEPDWIGNCGFIHFSFEAAYPTNDDLGVVSVNASLTQNPVRRWDNGWLRLPPNYSQSGEKVPLVIMVQGTGGFPFNLSREVSSELGRNGQIYMARSGYAIMSCCGLTNENASLSGTFGAPSQVSSIVSCVEYLGRNYNIDVNRVYIFGKSVGGLSTLRVLLGKYLNVRAAGMFAPSISWLVSSIRVPSETGAIIKMAMDQCGCDPTLTWQDRAGAVGATGNDTDLPQLIANMGLLAKNDPFFMNCDIDAAAFVTAAFNIAIPESGNDWRNTLYGSDSTMNTLVGNAKMYLPAPVKCWQSPNDWEVPWCILQWLKSMIDKTHGNFVIREMPSTNDPHHSMDSGDDAPKVTAVPTYGTEPMTITVGYYELVEWFNKW